jgi:glycosyltransferase involved in cell wall biosynthesis
MAEPLATDGQSAASSEGDRTPLISIGMPVYNGAKYIGAALDSMLSQTYSDFSIIVSDNASVDGTGDILQDYALRDPRITYVRQSRNIGAEANFKFVFDASRGKYFMWAAADDIRSADFLERNICFLENHPDYLGSTLRTRFQGGGFDPTLMGDASLDQDDFAVRLIAFFERWHANGRFYSVFRRQALVPWVNADKYFLGSDWSLIVYLASAGKINRIEAGWTELGRSGVSNTTDVFSPYRKTPKNWLIPFLGLTGYTWQLMASAKIGQRAHIAWRLTILNLHAFLLQHKVMLKSRK